MKTIFINHVICKFPAFRKTIVPKFWNHFIVYSGQKSGGDDEPSEGSVEVMSRVATAVSELYDSAVSFIPQIHK